MMGSDLPVCLPASKLVRTATAHKSKSWSPRYRGIPSRVRGSRLLPVPV